MYVRDFAHVNRVLVGGVFTLSGFPLFFSFGSSHLSRYPIWGVSRWLDGLDRMGLLYLLTYLCLHIFCSKYIHAWWDRVRARLIGAVMVFILYHLSIYSFYVRSRVSCLRNVHMSLQPLIFALPAVRGCGSSPCAWVWVRSLQLYVRRDGTATRETRGPREADEARGVG